MNTNRSQASALALEPMDASDGRDGASSSQAQGSRELRITIADDLLAQVALEYQKGQIDPDLWAKASAETGSEPSLVIAAYLRARVRALQRQKLGETPSPRDDDAAAASSQPRPGERRDRRALRAVSTPDTGHRGAEPGPQAAIPSPPAGVAAARGKPKLTHAAAAVVALVAGVAVLGWVLSPRTGEPAAQPEAVVAAPSPSGAVASGPVAGAQTTPAGAVGGAGPADSEPTLEAKVQELRDAGNWNVLVLYASKWTRDQPKNATAWDELSTGYANLRQFDDALVAATRAAELMPGEPRLWRHVGHLNLTLGRLDEARGAFDRALALHAEDTDALCGASSVAREQGRTQDAAAIAEQVKAAGGSCPGASHGETVAVVAGGGVPPQAPVRSVRR